MSRRSAVSDAEVALELRRLEACLDGTEEAGRVGHRR